MQTDFIKPDDSVLYHYHPNGYLTLDHCPVTRAGIFLYEDENFPNGIRRDLRPPEEVFAEKSLATLDSLPIIDLHPDVGIVTSQNFRGVDYIGSTHPELSTATRTSNDVTLGDGIVRAKITIYDQAAIDSFREGKSGSLSLGYTRDLVMQGGVYNGHEYDAVHTNIRYNHLSQVPIGRFGIDVREKLAVVDGFDSSSKLFFINNSKTNMSNEKETKATEVPQESVNDAAVLVAEITGLKTANQELTTALDSANEKVVELEAKLAESITKDEAAKIAADALYVMDAAVKLDVEMSREEALSDPLAAAQKVVSSKVEDASIYATLDSCSAFLNGVLYSAANAPKQPVSQTASSVAVDQAKSTATKDKGNRFDKNRRAYLAS